MRSPSAVRLTAPVFTVVLAATAIPIELRYPILSQLSFHAFRSDVFLNVVGYVPVGLVLARMNPLQVAAAAGIVATLAEAGQLFMSHRDPSAIDVACNVIGAILAAIALRWQRRGSLLLPLNRRVAAAVALLAGALMLWVWSRAPLPLNSRGSTTYGTLEAQWKFDESAGNAVIDSSGHGHDGTFRHEPKRVPGMYGSAVSLNGVNDYVDVGRASAFRLVGDMTISAWIEAASFPADDAAIVSNHNGIGYQLDTTVDQGTRTVGFKLGDACGSMMARYGATELLAGKWYHVAGVYDAAARTLDVYVDGRLDNGSLLGVVTGAQRSSREAVFIGRRSSDSGFEFAGLIDDVRLYSRALTAAEVEADMRGLSVASERILTAPVDGHVFRIEPSQCGARSDREDSRLPGAAGVLGVLVGVACLGFWPAAGWWPGVAASVIAGWLLVPAAAPSLPTLGHWLIPLTGLAGAVSVLASSTDANTGYER